MAHRKRLLDLVIGAMLAVVAAPIVLVLAAISAVVLRAWPFFVQERVGRHGRRFRIVKIRTLPPSAPAYADKYEIASVSIPPFCEWLRRSHLDELPQLFLVPLGHMSLVGPRPEMAMLLEKSDPEFVRVRSLVRPGCTGLWQVGGRTDSLIDESPDYDLYYLGESSLRLDCWILWRTFAVMFLRGGAVEPIDVPTWLCGWGLIPSREFIAVIEQRFHQQMNQSISTASVEGLSPGSPEGPARVSIVSSQPGVVLDRRPSSVAS